VSEARIPLLIPGTTLELKPSRVPAKRRPAVSWAPWFQQRADGKRHWIRQSRMMDRFQESIVHRAVAEAVLGTFIDSPPRQLTLQEQIRGVLRSMGEAWNAILEALKV
jgi:hypothetical protein